MTETIILTAVGSALATLGGRVLWDRWRAPERIAREVRMGYVTRAECDKCLSGTQQRLQMMESGLAEFRNENRDDHGRLFDRLDALAREIRRSNGRGGGG